MDTQANAPALIWLRDLPQALGRSAQTVLRWRAKGITVEQADACSPDGSEFSAELGPYERAKLDALLDHIQEYGTTSEGVLRLASQLCQSVRAAQRERCAVAAWNHYMDTCRRLGRAPSMWNEWCASEVIRAA